MTGLEAFGLACVSGIALPIFQSVFETGGMFGGLGKKMMGGLAGGLGGLLGGGDMGLADSDDNSNGNGSLSTRIKKKKRHKKKR